MPAAAEFPQRGASRWLMVGGALLLLIFAAEQISIARINDWWIDELFSLWASDPSLGFGALFAARIAPDSNPPLYFSALHFARVVIPHDQTAIYALNLTALAAAIAVVIHMCGRAAMLAPGLLGSGVFLLSGPVLRYIPEARSYFLAIAFVFAASWYAAMLIMQNRWRPLLWLPVLLGAGAALAHLFAALACGVLAAGMLYAAFIQARRDIAVQSIVFGLSASLISLAWLGLAGAPTGNVGWIKFSLQSMRVAVWELKELAFGSRVGLLAFAGLLAFGLIHRPTRVLTSAFCVPFFLFAALPLIISLKMPIIVGRYWMIGMPMAITLAALLAEAWYRQAGFSLQWSIPSIGQGLAVLFFLSSSIGGFAAAHRFTATKPAWKGATVVAPLVKSCPAQSVRVLGATTLYALASDLSHTFFVDAAGTNAATAIDSSTCPVFGWAEHLGREDDYLEHATDEQLLEDLHLTAPPEQYEIRRHGSGYVVLRKSG